MEYFESDNQFKSYMIQIKQYSNLTVNEQKELGRRIIEGDQNAKEKLINFNLRFVASIALEIFHKHKNLNLSLRDLVQEGNIGLIRAIETYNPDIGAFTTYADSWIR